MCIRDSPGMGKTAFCLALAKNAAVDYNRPVAFFSLEMSALQLTHRLMSMVAEIPGSKLRNAQMEDYEWQQLNSAVERFSEVPILSLIHIWYPTQNMTFSDYNRK